MTYSGRALLLWTLLLIFPAGVALAAPADSLDHPSANELRSMLLHGSGVSAASTQMDGRKSVPLALGMAAVLPGAGQVYNGHWIKGAAFMAVEVGLITGYIIWHRRGLDAEDAYIEYAHQHWSAGRYAGWINDYVDYLNTELAAGIDVDPIVVPSGIDLRTPGMWTAQDHAIVRDLFDRIRAVENQLFHPETGASFSHHLPYFGEQQYYELIGKYYQFAPGWDDYPAWRVEGAFTSAIDPELSGPNGEKVNVDGRFLEYARDHGDANKLLRRASRVSAIVLLNHVVAAFDAAISAKLKNDRLAADLTLHHDAHGRPVLLGTARLRL